ncbi:hypothetical protein, partial [Mesonia sp.]|uniref:hypothetical protein n=1 Tax=Mesonia sp. TaxID=1960830 RepID=UPI0025C159C9
IGLVLMIIFFKANNLQLAYHREKIKKFQKRMRIAKHQIAKRELRLDTYHFLSYNLEEVLVVQENIHLNK